MEQKSLKLTFGQQVSPARISHLREWGRAAGFEGTSLDSFMTLSDSLENACQEPLSSKTCTAFSLATEDATSPSYSRRWTNSGMAWRGVCLTAKTLESPSNAAASTLLPFIETQEVPEKYFLSPNAARGCLRRAERMGRNLFPPFKQALSILAQKEQ